MSKSNLTAIEIVLADPANQVAIDHLRSRQNEIWTKSGSVLGFDGLLVASQLVLVSSQYSGMLPNTPFETYGFFVSLAMILLSGLIALVAINQNGRYPGGKKAAEHLSEFTAVMARSNFFYRISAFLCFWGALLFIIVLFSVLITSGEFSFDLPFRGSNRAG